MWDMVDIHTNSKKLVGYVYRTHALGTQQNTYPSKSPTELRLVCSITEDDPLLILMWEYESGTGDVNITSFIDSDKIDIQWHQDDKLLIVRMQDVKDLMKAMNNGRSIKFIWTGADNIQRVTMFSLSGFNQQMFITRCSNK